MRSSRENAGNSAELVGIGRSTPLNMIGAEVVRIARVAAGMHRAEIARPQEVRDQAARLRELFAGREGAQS